MASRVPAANTGTAFIGGAQSRNLAPPTVIGQGIPSANTSVGSPIGGVNPSQIKSARPNEGSNIGIPYSRLVPLQNGNALFAADFDQADYPLRGTGPKGERKLVTETEDLRDHTLAFVLGLRGSTAPAKAANVPGDGSGVPGGVLGDGPNPPVYNGHNVGFQPALMPGMVGTERFQQLCSLEYLHAYFHNVLSGKTIALNDGKTIDSIQKTVLNVDDRTTGPLGELLARKVDLTASTLINAKDLAKQMVSAKAPMNAKQLDKDGKPTTTDVDPKQMQGIFTRDMGPFLIGKVGATRLVVGTENNLPDGATQPYAISRNLGDDVAFSVLDSLMAQKGLTDWRPDGIVLSKGANDPSDKLSDEYLEARDGALYNLRVQGPAIGTTWTGDRSMETLPLDKVFVLLVADVWFNGASGSDKWQATDAKGTKVGAEYDLKDLLDTNGITTKDQRTAYLNIAEKALSDGLDEDDFAGKMATAWAGGEAPVLANFRIVASTSSQMINHSQFKSKSNTGGESAKKKPKLDGKSRMGLRLSNRMGQYVVGGWQIGNVLDTSASRAAMPKGSNIGVRTAPNSSALNINVNIGWWTADRLARAFNNAGGTITPRHVETKPAPSADPTGNDHQDTS